MNGRTVLLAFIVHCINVPTAWWLLLNGHPIPAVIVITFGNIIIWLIAFGKIKVNP